MYPGDVVSLQRCQIGGISMSIGLQVKGMAHGVDRALFNSCRRTAAVLIAVLSLGILLLPTPSFAAGRVLYAAPTGAGSACSSASPCSVANAVAAAGAGDSVILLAGSYGDVTIRGGGGTAAAPITVAPAAGATATFGRLGTYSPYVTWRSITVTVTFYIYSTAAGTTVDAAKLNGGGMFLRSTNVTVRNSIFQNGVSLDALQISSAKNVLIEHNTVRDYNQSGTTGYHADCIQIYDSVGVTLRGNNLRNCYNSAIIFSPGQGKGISNVLIESNFVQGCLVKSAKCSNGNNLDLRYSSVSNITVRNNTFLTGTVRLTSPGVVFDRNIVDYLSDCGAVMTNSVVSSWNKGMCARPASIGTRGNRQGVVPVQDKATGNLHLLTAGSARITPFAGPVPAPRDYDGKAMLAELAGADSVAGSSGPADITRPAVAIVSPSNGSAITGKVTLKASATDNVGVSNVRFLVQSTALGEAALQSGTWNLSVNTAGFGSGTYAVTAQATDLSGNTTISAPITFNLRN